MQANGELLTGQKIRDLVTVTGVRVTVQDGTWGLVRASSNKPELVVVVESPVSESRMREMFAAIDAGPGDIECERGYITHWVESTENANPLYWDESVANDITGGWIAPPLGNSV